MVIGHSKSQYPNQGLGNEDAPACGAQRFHKFVFERSLYAGVYKNGRFIVDRVDTVVYERIPTLFHHSPIYFKFL
jgi:hypothetical protein